MDRAPSLTLDLVCERVFSLWNLALLLKKGERSTRVFVKPMHSEKYYARSSSRTTSKGLTISIKKNQNFELNTKTNSFETPVAVTSLS